MSDKNMKKYVVTDPGYITKDDDVWEHFVKVINDEEMRNKVLSDYLGCQIFTSATGYGDWQNFDRTDPEWTVLKITDTHSVYTSIDMNPDRIAEYLATGDDDDE